ncbi:MAG: hypothetical protein LBG62_00295 [Candidatus Methanoplasma sp.]|jgi:predicted transcriptional regulator|nr:hypothetical protein [Candidatus Methanoplasma sp.]
MSGASMLEKAVGELELLRRHMRTLNAVREFQPVGIIRLSEIMGLPKHEVRYSLRLLEREGLIVATAEGATESPACAGFMASLPGRLDEVSREIEALRAEISGDANI